MSTITSILNKIMGQALSDMTENHEGQEEEILRIIKARINKDAHGFSNKRKVLAYDYYNADSFIINYQHDFDDASTGNYLVFFVHGISNVGNDSAPKEYTPEDLIYYVDAEYTTSVVLVYRKIGGTLEDYINAGLVTYLTDLREVSKGEYETCYASRETRQIEMMHVDNDIFRAYDLSPYNYCIDDLPEKDGFKTITLDKITHYEEYNIPLDEMFQVIPPSDTERALPYVEFTKYASPFYHFVTAKNGKVIPAQENTRVIDFHAIIMTGFEVYYFNPEFGAARIDRDSSVWRIIGSDSVLPQYLLIELQKDYAKKQYNFANEKAFKYTKVYIPDGDPVISLYEQMRIYNDLRQKEINKLLYATGASLDPGRSLTSGTLLKDENIVISEHIDDGGFGKIYMATDLTAKGRPTVALKELFVKQYCTRNLFDGKVRVMEYLADDYEHQKKKFHDEYNILAALYKRTHYVPAVDTKRGIIEANNTLYYILQYVSNDTLWHYCRQENVPQSKIIGIVCQAGIALHHCHSINYLHLDVTPSNIMIDEQYNGVLIDFGNSKHYSVDRGSMTSVSREAAHTPRYTPPELQNQRQRMYYMQTDIYQLALTLYSALTGCQPPERESMDNDDWYYGVLREQLVKANVSESIISAIFKAVSYRYEDRYPTVLDFLKELPLDNVDDSIRSDIYSLQPVASFSQVANNMPEIYEQENQIEESIL